MRSPLPAVATAVSFIDCINRTDIDGLARLMAEDHALRVFDEPPSVGREENVDAWRGYFANFPEYVIYPRCITEHQGGVAILGHTSGSHLGLTEDEETASTLIWLATVVDGLVQSWTLVEDTSHERRKRGIVTAAAEDPRHHLGRNRVLAGLVGNGGGGRRAFVDATGTSVALPPVIRRLVATDDEVGALLLGLGAPIVGCAGTLDGVVVVGAPRVPDPRAVAAVRPDVILTGAVGRMHDLLGVGLVGALWQVAPVVAVEARRPAMATADLRALLGPSVGGGRPATEPISDRRVGAP